MAKIFRNKITGMLGVVLTGHEDGTTDLAALGKFGEGKQS